MIKIIILVLLTFSVISCASNSPEGKLEEIQKTEEKLMEMSISPQLNQDEYNLAEKAYIEELIDFYHAFPENDKAAGCLDKVHMIYSGTGKFDLASQWADTLLLKYPKYINRALVLESQASTYDAIVEPRDSTKVRKYYTQLLNEYPNLDKDKKEGIEKRLKYNKLSFDEYIILQMKDEAIGE